MKHVVAIVVVTVLAGRPARANQSVVVDAAGKGAVFDGVGATDAGGNNRLLIDYPEPQRSQILDYLFKPGYGAAMQILKVEIGGDTNSTDGATPSHQHTRGDANYDRGYDWWLMVEAKKRNPAIKISALAWGAPGWVGSTFWTNDTITYLVDWVKNAKQRHGITVDTIGGWNEKGHNAGWYKNFKAALTAAGLTTKVVGDDSLGWKVADTMAADPAFAASIDILGSHYPCGYHSEMTTCTSTAGALATGKPLWASENGSVDYNKGAAAVARAINRGYIDARMTAYLNWPLIAGIYPNMAFATFGLIVANSPWSGHYDVGKLVWASAHTTQVTSPGWRYIDGASGYFGGDRTNGSYVTLRAPSGGDYSIVIETTTATAPQTMDVTLTGGAATGSVHVWASNLTSNNLADDFVAQPDLTPQAGAYSFTAQPGWVYSLTTTNGAGRGNAASGPARPLPLPYADTFDSYPAGKQPRLLSDMQGAFETVTCGGGRPGICVRQMAVQAPILWTKPTVPYAVLGDVGWADYTVQASVLLEKAGAASVLARVSKIKYAYFTGYVFSVGDDGNWSLELSDAAGTRTKLASGTGPGLGINQWHKLALTAKGTTLTGSVDGKVVGSITVANATTGLAGLATGDYVAAQFDELWIGAPDGMPALPDGGVPGARDAGVPGARDAGDSRPDADVMADDAASPSSDAAGPPKTLPADGSSSRQDPDDGERPLPPSPRVNSAGCGCDLSQRSSNGTAAVGGVILLVAWRRRHTRRRS